MTDYDRAKPETVDIRSGRVDSNVQRGSTPLTPYASALTASSARVASLECLRTFPSTASRYPHVTDRPGEQVTSRRWRNATAICPPELRNVRTCSCIMLRAAHTSALPHTHTLTHAAPARALRSVADPERSLLDGSPSGRLRAPQQPRPLPRHSREPTRHHL